MQRERRNVEDQRIVPPFQNNEVEEMEESNDIGDDSAVLFNETDLYPSHLTQQEYEISQLSNMFDDDRKGEEVFQSQPQKKYDLRPRLGGPKKNVPTQNKKSDLPPKQGPNKDTGNKADQQQQPTKPVVSEVKEVDRHVTYFNIEHELRKIKIHVPLTELMKNDPLKGLS
jgi:hypothetical protein